MPSTSRARGRVAAAHDPRGDTARRSYRADGARCRERRSTARASSAKAAPLFDKRGQLLPRERVARLLDPGVPFLELSTLAGWLQDVPDPKQSRSPAAASIVGIGVVSGTRVMLVADDAGIDAGALQAGGLDKFLRAQAIALENKLPFVHLVESAGANLLKYRVEQFIRGGALFCNLARLSAAGLPVIARRARLVDGRRRLHDRAGRLRDDGARPRAAPSSPARRC